MYQTPVNYINDVISPSYRDLYALKTCAVSATIYERIVAKIVSATKL